MNALRDKAKAAAGVIAAKASAAKEAAVEKAKKEAESATEYVQQKAEEIKPKLRAAMAGAEPSIQEFLKHPDVEYLKQNPDVIVVVCEILAFLGIPGAASICMLIGMSGPADMLIPLVMAMAGPVASLRVSESGFLK